MTGKIIVATDGSDIGYHAMDLADTFSKTLGEDLCVVHILMQIRSQKNTYGSPRLKAL